MDMWIGLRDEVWCWVLGLQSDFRTEVRDKIQGGVKFLDCVRVMSGG